MSGELSGVPDRPQAAFAEVRIGRAARDAVGAAVEVAAGARTTGQISIELPSGVRLTVDGEVDAEALSRVISVLAR
jgi:transposase